MKQKLTARQKAILDFVKLYMAKNRMPPTRREIQEAFEFKSPNAAQDHLYLIERKGWIRLLKGPTGQRSSRGIALL